MKTTPIHKLVYAIGATVATILLVGVAIVFLDAGQLSDGAPIFALAIVLALVLLWIFTTANRRAVEKYIRTRDKSALRAMIFGAKEKSDKH